jgi:isopenicillin-N epimerase
LRPAIEPQTKVLGVTWVHSGTYTWLFGPSGTGIVWAQAENWSRIRPTIPTFSDFEQYIAGMENRVPNSSTQASWVTPRGFVAYEYQWAMTEAFRFHEQIGRERIAARITQLNDRLKDGLSESHGITLHTPRNPALSEGIVCFDVKGLQPDEVVHRLRARKIIATTTPYNVSHARLAAGIMNSPDEIDEVLRAVRGLV